MVIFLRNRFLFGKYSASATAIFGLQSLQFLIIFHPWKNPALGIIKSYNRYFEVIYFPHLSCQNYSSKIYSLQSYYLSLEQTIQGLPFIQQLNIPRHVMVFVTPMKLLMTGLYIFVDPIPMVRYWVISLSKISSCSIKKYFNSSLRTLSSFALIKANALYSLAIILGGLIRKHTVLLQNKIFSLSTCSILTSRSSNAAT